MRTTISRAKRAFQRTNQAYNPDTVQQVEELRLTINRLGQDVLFFQKLVVGLAVLLVVVAVTSWLA